MLVRSTVPSSSSSGTDEADTKADTTTAAVEAIAGAASSISSAITSTLSATVAAADSLPAVVILPLQPARLGVRCIPWRVRQLLRGHGRMPSLGDMAPGP